MQKCKGCENELRSVTQKFCSHKCYLRSQRKIVNCPICKKEITVPKSCEDKRACGKECKSKWRSEVSKKTGFGEGEKNVNWVDGKMVDRYGYVYVREKGGWQLEHRAVMEKHLGRKLVSSEHVHHINCEKSDNGIDNLQYCKNNSTHLKAHRSIERIIKPLIDNGIINFNKDKNIYELTLT